MYCDAKYLLLFILDDRNIYRSIVNLDRQVLQNKLFLVYKWSVEDGLPIKLYIHLGIPSGKRESESDDYFMNDRLLENVSKVKVLGVMIYDRIYSNPYM